MVVGSQDIGRLAQCKLVQASFQVRGFVVHYELPRLLAFGKRKLADSPPFVWVLASDEMMSNSWHPRLVLKTKAHSNVISQTQSRTEY